MPDHLPTNLEIDDRDVGLPLSEAVFRSLRRALRSGLYRPGDRLREDDVAQRLKVSRTPVREALSRLMAKGFVEAAGGRGLVVRRLDAAEILELYAMREILEGAAARLAAQHATAPETDALLDLEKMFEAKQDDPGEMARINRALHEAIFRAARNRYLDRALQELQDGIALLGATTFSVSGRPSSAVHEHQNLINAIIRHDPDEAEKQARSHIQAALRSRLVLIQAQ